MKIEWTEDLSGGTNERPIWALRGVAGDVAVERRSDVTLNTSTRRLENMRLEVLDGIRAGLGLPQDALREGDITGVAEAMAALRRMALKAERVEAER